MLLPFIFMFIYLGVRLFCLHILLYQIAALRLYSFSLMFLYLCFPFAYWAKINLTLCVPCIILQGVMNDKMHNSVIISFIPQFFCLLYMFRTILFVHHQEHKIMYCTVFCPPVDGRLDSFETCRADKQIVE